jgi:hypothetical protein
MSGTMWVGWVWIPEPTEWRSVTRLYLLGHIRVRRRGKKKVGKGGEII